MATVAADLMTAEQFFAWVHRPENRGRYWELERGEIIAMPPPGEAHGIIASLVAHYFWNFVIQHGKGYVCSNDTGLVVEMDPDTVRGPDVMLFDEPLKMSEVKNTYATTIPKVVVEVMSPSDSMGKTMRRIKQYLNRGVPLVWLVYPEDKLVSIHRQGQELRTVEIDGLLTGEEVLPGLEIRLRQIFFLPSEGCAMNLDKEYQQIHTDLGWIRLSNAWAKCEIVLGLFGMAIAIVLLTDLHNDPLGCAAGVPLFIFGGYLTLCGHRSHLYQSHLQLSAYLLHHIQQSHEKVPQHEHSH